MTAPSPPAGGARRRRALVPALAVLALVVLYASWPRRPRPIELPAGGATAGWPHYGGDVGGLRYSTLDQIGPDNVGHLEIAWTYHTGDVYRGEGGLTAFEGTPILVDETLYLCTPYNRVIALDPETGEERWSFDPELDRSVDYGNQFVCRGVAHWSDAAAAGPCARRILTATNDGRLIALDAATGAPCADFGERGEVDLRQGIGALAWPGEYQVTSAPQVVGDLVVVGSAVSDNVRTDAPPGVVRAYDARDGALRWAWDPVPAPAESEVSSEHGWLRGERYFLGTPNVWAPMSADPERGLVFLPTGNPSPDYWAAHRRGLDAFGSSVVALEAETGAVAWSYQTVHHDLWDFDVPAQPTLFSLRRNGSEIPALVQATKMGFLFVLDRETGQPLFPVEERPVPQTTIEGEVTSPTQPFPIALPHLADEGLAAEQAFGFTPWDRGACRRRIEQLRFEGIFTPPSLEGTLMVPGNAGGSNWGGVAVDPERQVLVANTMNLAWSVTLFERDRLDELRERFPEAELSPQRGTPYWMMREMLLSPLGVPCGPPPWGELAAVDLASGELLWQVPLGTIRDLVPGPIPIHIRMGVPNLGGPLVTRSGLVFVGATFDAYLRAFDLETGEELWKGRLPAGGQATPMTYRLRPDGRQYVVIAAGGHARAGTKLGDAVVAFALRTR
jgi:quinoprotein glucose dehydrogenase